jgi:hypothetical protein
VGTFGVRVRVVIVVTAPALLLAACRGSESPRMLAVTLTSTGASVTAVAIAPSPTASQTPALPRDRVSPEAVWAIEPPAQRFLDCPRENQTQCGADIMSSLGASPAAVRFFEETGYILQAFREMGRVDLARLVNPYAIVSPALYEDPPYALVNGTPDIVRPRPPLGWPHGTFRSAARPEYGPIAKAVDDPTVFPGIAVFESEAPESGSRQAFHFRFAIQNSCYSCDTGYWERAAFDFGTDGIYLGSELLPPCWAPVSGAATPAPTVVDACPPPSAP